MRSTPLALFAAIALLLPALGGGLKCFTCDSRMNSACAAVRLDRDLVPVQELTAPGAVCYTLQGRRPPGGMGGIIEESGLLRGVMLQKDLDVIASSGELRGLQLHTCISDYCSITNGSPKSVMHLGLCATLVIVSICTNNILHYL